MEQMDELVIEGLRQHYRVLLKEAERIKAILTAHDYPHKRQGGGTMPAAKWDGIYNPATGRIESAELAVESQVTE